MTKKKKKKKNQQMTILIVNMTANPFKMITSVYFIQLFKFKFILFSSHIKQLRNTKNEYTLMKVNGDVDAIKEMQSV